MGDLLVEIISKVRIVPMEEKQNTGEITVERKGQKAGV